jgi:hypothetical protein
MLSGKQGSGPLSVEVIKLGDGQYRMALATENGSAVVDVTVPASKLEVYAEGEREIESFNLAISVVFDLLGEIIELENRENAGRT